MYTLSHKSYTLSKNLSNNKQAHILNGNIKINRLKILHWNKGNSLFKNKLDDIYFVLDKFQPHIMSISKANYDNKQLRTILYR